MTMQQAQQQLRLQLSSIYDESEAGIIAEWVMENLTGLGRTNLSLHKTHILTNKQIELLEKYSKGLLKYQPVQYVLQEAWFCGMKLYVDNNVLIPRPETEELADWIIKDYWKENATAKKSALDIGTGSGCIPIAIKKNIPAVDMHACDISEGALQVAKKNAVEQNTTVHFHLLDILSAVDQSVLPVFDIIVSNPPYIPLKDKSEMSANVLAYEPSLALFVTDENPLLFYEAIADFAQTHLHRSGQIYLEIHEALGKDVVVLYRAKGFTQIELRKDMQGKDRMVKVGW